MEDENIDVRDCKDGCPDKKHNGLSTLNQTVFLRCASLYSNGLK